MGNTGKKVLLSHKPDEYNTFLYCARCECTGENLGLKVDNESMHRMVTDVSDPGCLAKGIVVGTQGHLQKDRTGYWEKRVQQHGCSQLLSVNGIDAARPAPTKDAQFEVGDKVQALHLKAGEVKQTWHRYTIKGQCSLNANRKPNQPLCTKPRFGHGPYTATDTIGTAYLCDATWIDDNDDGTLTMEDLNKVPHTKPVSEIRSTAATELLENPKRLPLTMRFLVDEQCPTCRGEGSHGYVPIPEGHPKFSKDLSRRRLADYGSSTQRHIRRLLASEASGSA